MKPDRARSPRNQGNDAGVAAIEFVIVLPVLLLLFFGMINLTSYFATMRKVSAAAELVVDLVSRHENDVSSNDIDVYFDAAALLFLPASAANLQVQLYNYRLDSGAVTTRWQRFRTAGTCAPPNTSDPEILTMLAASDVLIAVACIPGYTAPAQFPGLRALAVPRKSLALRPRHSLELLCPTC